MKDKMKYLVFLLLSIIGLLVASNYFTYNKLQSSLDESKDYKFKYTLVKDSLGREHAQYKVEGHHLNELNSEDKALVEKTAKSLGSKPKDIKSVTQVSTSTTDTFHLSLDTPSFNDGHLSLDVIKTPTSITGTYTYKDTCWLTTYVKSKRVLGIKYKEDTYGDIHFGNPKTSITGLNHISIDKFIKPKHWVVGPSVGVMYNGSITPYIGFGVTYKLLSF